MFRRDGHLSDLGLELIEVGESEGTQHLETCEMCSDRRAQLARHQADFESLPPFELPGLPPSLAEAPPSTRPANRGRFLMPFIAAAAAAIILALQPTVTEPTDDTPEAFRSKGPALDLRVHIEDGTSTRVARPDDHVLPGDRLGFSFQAREGGHLIIAGIDQANDPYLCFPQGGSTDAQWVEASTDFVPLEEAVRLDATPGSEDLVALLCERPVTWGEVAAALEDVGSMRPLPKLIEGCAQQTRSLTKGEK